MKKLLCVLATVMLIFSGVIQLAEASSVVGNVHPQGEITQTNSKKTAYKKPSRQPQTAKQKQQQKKDKKDRRAFNKARRESW